jgi:hypothetical protein
MSSFYRFFIPAEKNDYLFLPMVKYMSEIAKAGFQAEKSLATQLNVKEALETYFAKPISTISVIPGSKKTDNRIDFVDGSNTNIQLKNYNTATIHEGRAHQLNRRPLSKCPPEWIGILSHICLGRSKSKGRMKGVCNMEFYSPFIMPTVEDSKALVSDVLLGKEAVFAPDYMVLSYMKDGVIEGLWIETMAQFISICHAAMYEIPQESTKGTSVFICPEVSIQRKGGDGGKPSANDIQFKFNLNKEILARHSFVKII